MATVEQGRRAGENLGDDSSEDEVPAGQEDRITKTDCINEILVKQDGKVGRNDPQDHVDGSL